MTANSLDQLKNRPVTQLKGVGDKLAEKLARLGCHSCGDLLLHLPHRYQDRTQVIAIGQLNSGSNAVFEGQVVESKVSFGRKRSLTTVLEDDSGMITLRFFYFNKSQQARFTPGQWFRCFGEAKWYNNGLTMIHPECQAIPMAGANFQKETTLSPIYPLVDGLTQPTLRKLIQQVLQLATPEQFPELLDQSFWQQTSHLKLIPNLLAAIKLIHYPPPELAETLANFSHPAQHRLAFEELLAEQLALMKLRDETARLPAAQISGNGSLTNALLMSLPFNPTDAQQKVTHEIYLDLALSKPMQRLVQGDVGSGKTLVAALAILRAVESGYQAVFMAPTEILAEQHFQTLTNWFDPLGVTVDWLTGKRKGKNREKALQKALSGDTKVVIGTHAVFQQGVEFANLALVVIDEQHRFGVGQRFSLREKGTGPNGFPHQLIMTATPIPRTLAMTLYADLDVSIIDELPPGRTPIKTVALNNHRRPEVVNRVKKVCAEGGQIYWVCSLIETNEVMEAKDAETLYGELKKQLTPYNIGLVHGRMKAAEKDSVMQAFKTNELQVLVATTVIEVGVDVPNASIMVIENTERFGLSQLHQLRGRVGRGEIESYCLLLYQEPLGDMAKARIKTLRDSTNGFDIAQKDLELRGAGEVLGTKQTGEQGLRIANIGRDAHLLPTVQSAALWLRTEQSTTVEALIQRWRQHTIDYGNV
jgi:ATP-dependent DNA helicase RecG